LDPTKRYKILAAQWAVFLEQRSNPEFLAKSEANLELEEEQVPPPPRHRWLPMVGPQMEARRGWEEGRRVASTV